MINEGYTGGYFVIVTFHSYKGQSANYWKSIWKSVENKKNPDFVQNDRNEEDIIEEQIYDDQYEYDLNEVDLPGLRPGESPIAYERRLNAISQTEREDNNE